MSRSSNCVCYCYFDFLDFCNIHIELLNSNLLNVEVLSLVITGVVVTLIRLPSNEVDSNDEPCFRSYAVIGSCREKSRYSSVSTESDAGQTADQADFTHDTSTQANCLDITKEEIKQENETEDLLNLPKHDQLKKKIEGELFLK
jgi:hypothetical protein